MTPTHRATATALYQAKLNLHWIEQEAANIDQAHDARDIVKELAIKLRRVKKRKL